jgi:hypothetical protein
MDENLLNLECYEDYLQSMALPEDLYYLGSMELCRQIVANGMRSVKKPLTCTEFEEMKREILALKMTSHKPHMMFSYEIPIDDPFLLALSERERANRIGDLSTIIFVRSHKKSGTEISGYIDFAASLKHAKDRTYEGANDWLAMFSGTKKLWPKPHDLGYYNWKTGKAAVNDSDNYISFAQPGSMLRFKNKFDGIIVNPTPIDDEIGPGSKRFFFRTTMYKHAVIYDHMVRKRF